MSNPTFVQVEVDFNCDLVGVVTIVNISNQLCKYITYSEARAGGLVQKDYIITGEWREGSDVTLNS